MTQRQYGFVCDTPRCGHAVAFENPPITSLRRQLVGARLLGWRRIQYGGAVRDYCPECDPPREGRGEGEDA